MIGPKEIHSIRNRAGEPKELDNVMQQAEIFLLTQSGLFLLVFARIAGTLLPLPIFGAKTVPRKVRFATAAVLALVVMPTLDTGGAIPAGALAFGAAVVLEFALGWGAGLLVALVFAALAMLGDLISRLGGFSVASSFDPALGESVPALTPFLTTLGVVVFLLVGGLESFTAGVMESFARFVPGSAPNAEQALALLLETVQSATSLALRMAVPFMIASLTVWLTAGLLGRFALGASAMSAGFSANTLLALSILNLSLAGILLAFAGELPAAFQAFRTFFEPFGG